MYRLLTLQQCSLLGLVFVNNVYIAVQTITNLAMVRIAAMVYFKMVKIYCCTYVEHSYTFIIHHHALLSFAIMSFHHFIVMQCFGLHLHMILCCRGS